MPPLEYFHVGALPVVNHFLRRLGMKQILESYLGRADRRQKLSPTPALLVLVRNLLISREPLYGVGAWAKSFEPGLLGLSDAEVSLLNDDRLGRALEDMFDADCPSLILRIAVQAVREFKLRLDRFHNDSTTISFQGLYRLADGRKHRGKPTPKITFGRSKDRRSDLRQLLWSLTVTADGAVPVNYQVLDGNTTDDKTHRDTWDMLCALAGGPHFLYVADSKLCTRSNLMHIDGRQGRFLTVLPATRKEDRRFKDWLQTHPVPWKIVAKRSHRLKNHAPDIFRAYEDPAGSLEGFRIVWFHSSEKEKRDRQERDEKIDRAVRQLMELEDRLASPRTRLRRRNKVDEAIHEILERSGAGRWIEVDVRRQEENIYRQSRPGRPGPTTTYRRKTRSRFTISWTAKQEALAYDLKTDGIFPLTSNDRLITHRRMLNFYKLGQPPVEQRHHLLKAFHEVAPQYLKSITRVVAFLCVYFLALLVNALIERQIRLSMKLRRLKALHLYPEDRPCKQPTTQQILKTFDGLMVHKIGAPGKHGGVYPPTLSRLHYRILRLLNIPPAFYRFQIGDAS